MPDTPIHVLLATCNGERFLQAQLDSVIAQDDRDWLLLARDDGSADGTPELLRDAARADPRIAIIEDSRGRLGSAGNFFALMQCALRNGAQYFALCDQDDIWVPHKLRAMRTAIRNAEASAATPLALLVYSDLEWIGADGGVLAPSHFRCAGAEQVLSGAGLWLLAMNLIPGCAMMGNRALLEAALPAPAVMLHHDWWLALLAASSGRIVAMDEALVRYRQHDANAVGADTPLSRIRQALRAPSRMLERGSRTYWQAVELADNLRTRVEPRCLQPGWRQAIDHAVERLGAPSRWRRACAVAQGPVRRIGWSRVLLMLVSSLRSRDGSDIIGRRAPKAKARGVR